MNSRPCRRTIFLAALAVISSLLAPWARAQPAAAPAADDEARHVELRALRDQFVAAMNKGDLDAMLAFAHPDIVYTPQDGTPLLGPEAIRAYSVKMLEGEGRIVESLTVEPTTDRPAVFFGDTAVASGSSIDTFNLTDGRKFVLNSRWTATVVRQDGRWLITSLHLSGNLFDNPILGMVKGLVVKAAIGGLVAGIILTGVLAWLTRKRAKPAA